MTVIRLDDRRLPHPRRAQRLLRMKAACPPPIDLLSTQAQLRRCHRDPALRAQILAAMKVQVA
jgi:hypothetical protein